MKAGVVKAGSFAHSACKDDACAIAQAPRPTTKFGSGVDPTGCWARHSQDQRGRSVTDLGGRPARRQRGGHSYRTEPTKTPRDSGDAADLTSRRVFRYDAVVM